MNWWNEIHEEEWSDETKAYIPERDKIEGYEAKNYTLGCRICGSLTGEHSFSFDSRRAE